MQEKVNFMKKIKHVKNNMLRGDGNATKALLIDVAGKLIAEQGYEKTTSKNICERAKANSAAINYHFGSHDGLYVAVLEEVHRYLLNIKELQEIEEKNISAKEKLVQFLDTFILNVWKKECWQIKVWARELMNPSPFIAKILSENAIPKFNVVVKIFSEYTGLSKNNPKLYSCILSTMAPFALTFLVRRNNTEVINLLPVRYSEEDLIEDLKAFALQGIDVFCQK
jgi:TetR/AcrR family transcriptional regulator, regulator of cefoperazone and chloramphenicol sensitivity